MGKNRKLIYILRKFCILLTLLMGFMGAMKVLYAQPIINNPLIRPPKSYAAEQSSVAGSRSERAHEQTGSVSKSPLPGALNSSSGNLPMIGDPLKPEQEAMTIPEALTQSVNGLFVTAILDKVAMLRTQTSVGQGGQSTNTGASQSAGAPGGLGQQRSLSYIIRDGEVIDYFAGYRVIARVQPDSVALYWLPNSADENGSNKSTRIIYKASIDTNFISTTIAERKLEGPGGGLDGGVRQSAVNPATGAAPK